MKLKVMCREMLVFVSFIHVLLFSGADGAIAIRPQNLVVVKGSKMTLPCVSDSDAAKPNWTFLPYIRGGIGEGTAATKDDCQRAVDFVYSTYSPDARMCGLVIDDTVNRATLRYTCKFGADKARVIVIVLESPLKCGVENNQYSCTMNNSAYYNKTAIVTPYLSSRLIWKDARGNIVGSKYADFQNPQTTVKAPIPGVPDAATRGSPYVCSAEFQMVGNLGTEYSSGVDIVPGDKLECQYPEPAPATYGVTATTGFRVLYSNMGRRVTHP